MLYHLQTSLGWIGISITNQKVVRLEFLDEPPRQQVKPENYASVVSEQLQSYFQGNLINFSLQIELKGTNFQHQVWTECSRIPYGKVVTYSDIARNIGRSGSARAVGNAVGANPLPVVIPCHRVVAKNGLGGFSGGLWRKELLHRLEDIDI
ncbi:MAG: methylated-DNA--[protein]-cysteine S-methyltransferase [Candidatus Cloacimonetes bacterium]|nr:methylated-DNA--[protein]-cysteine S-methyltransferase [Candidatus Cloacimonadota bacterium]